MTHNQDSHLILCLFSSKYKHHLSINHYDDIKANFPRVDRASIDIVFQSCFDNLIYCNIALHLTGVPFNQLYHFCS